MEHDGIINILLVIIGYFLFWKVLFYFLTVYLLTFIRVSFQERHDFKQYTQRLPIHFTVAPFLIGLCVLAYMFLSPNKLLDPPECNATNASCYAPLPVTLVQSIFFLGGESSLMLCIPLLLISIVSLRIRVLNETTKRHVSGSCFSISMTLLVLWRVISIFFNVK